MYIRLKDNRWFKYILFSLFYWITAVVLVKRAIGGGYIALGGTDAVTQMYPCMLYISRVVREFFIAVFTDETFVFPMFEWSLGMGENTIATLNYYGFGDPFYLLSAFVSEENMPHFYTMFYYFRLYLGGIACIAFFEELNLQKSNCAYVISGLVYTFSGFTLQTNIFIIFVHAMMYTPMLLMGAERSIKGKKRWLLTLSVFLYALSGFFFLYVASISLAMYVLWRMCSKHINIKKAVQQIMGMICEYVVGISLAAVIFIPSVVGFLSSNRASVFGLSFKIIPWSEIKSLLLNMFFPQYFTTQTMSVCAIAIICVLVVLGSKKFLKEKLGIFLVFLTMIIPACTTIMSGFGGYYDRWQIVLVLYFAYITFIMWDELEDLSLMQIAVVTFVYLIIGVYGKREGLFDNVNYKHTIISYGLIITYIYIGKISRIVNKFKITECIKVVSFVLIAWTVCRSWSIIARDLEIDLVRQEKIVNQLVLSEDKEFYRVDYEKTFAEPRLGMNISFMQGYPGISQYYSIENVNYINSFGEWESGKVTHNNDGLDQRTILETVSSVKYFVVCSENKLIVPYGFEKVKSTDDGVWELYENTYALPIMYMYDNAYSIDKYNEMNGLEKQDVLLQAAAIEGYKGGVSVISEVENNLYEGNYEIVKLQNAVLDDKGLHVEAGGVVTLKALLKANCENYLYFDVNPKIEVNIDDEYIKYRESTTLGRVEVDMYKTLEITFEQPISFSLDNMKIMYYDFENYDEYISNMNNGAISNIEVRTNCVKGEVNNKAAQILCLAVPYEKGWHAYIDGVETDTYKMNSMFTGIEVPSGIHKIEFRYVTPGIQMGCFITVFTIFVLLVGMIINYRLSKRVVK